VDFWGLLARWEKFEVEVESAFKLLENELKVNNPRVREEYRLSHRRLAIQGKVVVQLIQKVQDKRQAYYHLLADNKVRTDMENDLSKTSQTIQSDAVQASKQLGALQLAVNQRLTRTSRKLFLGMEEALLAFMFTYNVASYPDEFCNDNPATPNLTCDLDASAYEDLFDRLKKLIKTQKSTLSNLQTFSNTLKINTKEHPKVFDDLWADIFKATGALTFSIPTNLSEVEGWFRVRVNRVNVVFTTLDMEKLNILPGKPAVVEYMINMGPLVFDLTRSKREARYYSPVRSLRKSVGKKEGNWTNEAGQYNWPPLFGQGSVEIILNPTKKIDQSILQGVTEAEIEFECEGLALPQPKPT
jgi:hypothetical protein